MNPCYAFDQDVFEAVRILCKSEGLIPALESAHAIAYLLNHRDEFDHDEIVVVNYSGRGDKDMDTITRHFYGD